MRAMEEIAQLRKEIEFLRELVKAQNATIERLTKVSTPTWPWPTVVPNLPEPKFTYIPDFYTTCK